MWCLISQPNSVIFEVRVDPKAIGEECLQKVCEHLGISNEADYFGLKYENNKGEELWLNLRNPIDRQVSNHGHMPLLRLALRVKFWVPPHLLLQEKTRHLFYLHAKLDLIEKRLLATDWTVVAKLIAYIAQAEAGDYNPLNPPHDVYMQLATISSVSGSEKPENLLQMIINEHENCAGMKSTTAEYWLLKEVSALESFGEEIIHAKSHNNNVNIGVGPHGISIYDKSKDKQMIPFTAIQSASSHRRSFRLGYLSMDNADTNLEFKLDSNQTANGLYRAITEKHAFYSCETVRSAVTAQFIRDLKGTIVSIFNEDSTLGKKYVFDIRRTCREVYDNARRALYQQKQVFQETVDEKRIGSEGSERRNSHERLTKIMDAMTCKICMDSPIDTAFLPCAHFVTCCSCAARCERCPVCRSEITQAQKIYFELGDHEMCPLGS